MRSRPGHHFLAALVCVLACSAWADAPAPDIPDTPVGQTLRAWLDALNCRGTYFDFIRS
jgi:hypothetical protein